MINFLITLEKLPKKMMSELSHLAIQKNLILNLLILRKNMMDSYLHYPLIKKILI